MACTFSNPITEEEISDLLDDNNRPDLADHIRQCADCSQRLEVARQIETMFASELFRFDCPTTMELADYHFDFLDTALKSQIEEHLTVCSSCQSEYQELIAVLAHDHTLSEPEEVSPPASNVIFPPPGYFIAEVTRVRAQGVRGDKEHIRAHVQDLQILLDIQLSGTGYAIEGMLLPLDAQDTQWHRSYVELRMNNEAEAMAFTDDLGTFRCEIKKEGSATLLLVSSNGKAVAVQDLVIAPSAHTD